MIELSHITKTYGATVVIDDLSLLVEDGEFMVLVGPSGSGKSTALRMIAGLTRPDAGTTVIGDRDVTALPPQERDIAMVFQSYALYPHMSVRKNMEFGLQLRKTPRAERSRRVEEVARILELEQLLDRKPGALSGGQRQRVAMGRAMVREPAAFLMDEPLSNLDAQLRVQVRAELAQLRDRLRTTTVYVTHDQVEAMTLGDRVAVMHGGRLQQVDAPRALYERPATAFVAGFIGSPRMNFFRSRIDDGAITLGDTRIPVSGYPELPARGEEVMVGVRPHAFAVPGTARHGERTAGDDHIHLNVVADTVEDLGSTKVVHFTVPHAGASVKFRAEIDARSGVVTGEAVQLACSHADLYFFDAATEAAIDRPREARTVPV